MAPAQQATSVISVLAHHVMSQRLVREDTTAQQELSCPFAAQTATTILSLVQRLAATAVHAKLATIVSRTIVSLVSVPQVTTVVLLLLIQLLADLASISQRKACGMWSTASPARLVSSAQTTVSQTTRSIHAERANTVWKKLRLTLQLFAQLVTTSHTKQRPPQTIALSAQRVTSVARVPTIQHLAPLDTSVA